MRTIDIEGRKINVRALTPAEIDDLEPLGFGYALCVPDVEKANEAMKKPLELVLSEEDRVFLSGRGLPKSKAVWLAILKETYGSSDEEKNLKRTTDSSPTESE